jgi:hypothetical protein
MQQRIHKQEESDSATYKIQYKVDYEGEYVDIDEEKLGLCRERSSFSLGLFILPRFTTVP